MINIDPDGELRRRIEFARATGGILAPDDVVPGDIKGESYSVCDCVNAMANAMRPMTDAEFIDHIEDEIDLALARKVTEKRGLRYCWAWIRCYRQFVAQWLRDKLSGG